MDNDHLPVANPWLVGPSPVMALPRLQLEERILNLLSSQNMCVLATTGNEGPLATPVRYYHQHLTLFFTSQAGTPKLRNIEREPRVSIGIFAPLVGQASSRGAQVFGHAEVLLPGSNDFDEGMAVYRWQSDAVERGRSVLEVPRNPLVRVVADRIVYTEHWLRRNGYSPRQHWSRIDRDDDR
ncbi:pyridoxamine 5'-phosphate oxidase family protein [Streptosporangium roseum]|uniref:pyridoxamine 5'-phosphate oxidase family protein n=1 Tax=Streptosporangium roseum TaxID=2001 RepID=UPI0018CBF6E7|nr:pyridoxamine 5'-phosphate oxidase family protein [Streptosporangium roseum]